MSWGVISEFLRKEEAERLKELDAQDEASRKERRRIYQRCWARAKSVGLFGKLSQPPGFQGISEV